MPKVYAYVRISDENRQDSATQKSRITDYIIAQKLVVSRWFEFSVSGSTSNRDERGINDLLALLQPGDQLVISDIARLGRASITDTVEIITRLINGGITLHLAYNEQVISPTDNNDLGKIFIALGEAFAAVAGAKERSKKARAAIDRRRKEGLHVGRPKDAIIKSRLDKHESLIIKLIAQQFSQYYIADYLRVGRHTLRRWLSKREQLIEEAKGLELWTPEMSISDIKAKLKNSKSCRV